MKNSTPEELSLNETDKVRLRILAGMQRMTIKEFADLMIKAGIYTIEGELTAQYGGKVK